MSNIRCWIVTDFIKEVADKLGISPTRAANLAALYLSRNPKDGDVTFDKIKDTLEKEKTALEEVDLLVPAYNTVEYDSRQDLASHDKEGNITLMKFKKGEPGAWKEDFLHRYKGSKIYSDIVKTITSAKEAYLFSLYKEMYYVQRGLEKKPEYNNAAESNAIGKVKRWKELNNKPQAEQLEVIQDPKEYTVKYIPKGKTELEYTIRGNKIYNKHGEEVFKENSVDRNKIFAKLALSQKRAVVVTYKDKKYIVNSRNDILSVTSGKIMQWEDDNGDRKAILDLAANKFDSKEMWPKNSPLTNILEEKLKELGIQIKEADLGEGISGKFVANEHTIYYNPNSILDNTIVHEAIHAISTYYLNITDQESLPKNIKTAIKEINYCYELLKDAYIKENFYKNGKPKEGVNIEMAFNFWIDGDQSLYGLTSPSEMIAELTNPKFIEYIRKVDAKYKGKNIFQKLIDSILEFFKTNKEYKSIEKTVKDALLELINNPNKQLLDNYAKERLTVKDNLKKIKESKHIVLEKTAGNAILEKLESLPEGTTEASIEITLDIDSIKEQWSMRFPEGATRSLSKKGVLMVYQGLLFASLDGNVIVNNDNNTLTLPLKVYSLGALSTNELTLKDGNNGVSYVESYTPIYNTKDLKEQAKLVFTRHPELSSVGTIEEYVEYLTSIFPESVDHNIYWHGSDSDFSKGFESAERGEGSGAAHTKERNDFYLAKQAWSVLQYVSGVNRNSVDKNGFGHWNKLWWELKEIMSNGRRENNDWKDIVIGKDTVRQAIPNKRGEFNRDQGGSNGKWLEERKADYGYENRSDKDFFEEILGIKWGEDTFNTWTQRNAEIFKQLEATQPGINPVVINTINPIRESGQNTYYEEQRGLFTQAEKNGNDAILGASTDNEFNSDIAVVLNASNDNIHFLGNEADVKQFKDWKYQQAALTIAPTSTTAVKVEIFSGNWSREEVAKQTDKVFLFGDNTNDRINTHYVPSMTQAVIRGLPNAIGIDTKKDRGTSEGSYFTDSDFDTFKAQVDTAIQQAVNSGKTIVLPEGGIGTGKAQLQQRAPKLFDYLQEQLNKLQQEKRTVLNQSNQPVNLSEATDTTSQVSALLISNEDLEVINSLPNTTEARKAIRTFALPSNIAPATEIQEEEDEDPPVPGVEVLNINKEDPMAKLYLDLNSTERRDRVTMLSEIFSQAVTVLRNRKITQIEKQLQEEGKKEEPDLKVILALTSQLASFQDSDNGRRSFLRLTPLRELFSWVKLEIYKYQKEADSEYEADAYNKVLEHFDILMTQACVRIESNEGIRIIPDTVQHNDGKTTSLELGGTVQTAAQEQQNLEEQTDDDTEGKRATGNDGWSFKIRELDPRTTLSAAVRKVLSNIPMVGDSALDDLGRQRYLDPDTAHAILVDKLSYMVQPEDFYNPEGKNIVSKFPALSKLLKQYPWAGVLRNRLNSDPRVLSQFFVDFRKDFAAFIKVKESKVMDLNMPVAIDSVVTKIKRNYEQGILLDKDSIYNTTLGIKKEAASVGKELIQEASILTEDVTQLQGKENKEDKLEVTKKLVKLLKMVGYNATSSTITNMLNDEDSLTKVDTLVANLSIIFNNLEKDSDKVNSEHLVSSLYATAYENIAEVIGEIDVLDNVQTFREGGKDRPSYTAPNYISTLIKKLSRKDLRQKVLDEEFKKYSFFHKDGEWRNEWLRLLNKKDTRREILEQLRLVELKHIELNLGMPTAEYEDWTKSDMYSAFLAAYYSDGATGDFGYYHMPIFSDSPMSMFIRFKRYRGNYKAKLLPLFRKLVYQELDRMKLVEERREKIKKGEIKEIANYDKNGHKFHFIPALNTTTILGKTLKEAIAEHKKLGDKEAIDASIDTYVQQVIQEEFKQFKQEFFQSGADERFELMSLKGLKLKDMDAYLEEYFWNSQFATSLIIQLTVTDPAFFKNGIDFLKRFKQVYAAGNKLNTLSKYGRKTERVIYLSDEEITSASYSSIQKVLKDAVKSGRISAPIAKSIANKFKEVNATDAQALRSISSLRAVYDMMGMWTDEMEAAINNFKSGTWTGEDFDVVWLTIKPFLYTQVAKPSGREGEDIKVPHQNKNSEFLLLHTFNYIAAATSSSPLLRALTAFMEDNDIDVVMFESAVKCGGQGIINIAYSNDRLNDVIKSKLWEAIDKAAKEALKDKYDKASDFKKFKAGNDLLLENGIITQDLYNLRFDAVIPDEEETRNILNKNIRKNGEIDREVVHEFPYSEYMVQQPTPEHLFDTHAKFGSQFRNLIVSDLPDDFEVTINGKLYKKKELLELYDSLIIENLLDSWDTVTKIFGSIENLLLKLLSIVKGNPKYGRDFVDALQLVPHPTDSKKKVFNIPPNSPNMTAKYQELILSVFKNTITKQEIRGGNAILVSNFGFTRKLKLLFNEDGSIKGCECYLPAYSKKFYEPFMKENGELDINAMPEDLKKIIGYRIPTEGKYSMMPLYVKGFLPQQNGSAIMLPADLTLIAGSDFDVDKMFLMLPEFRMVPIYDHKKASLDFFLENPDLWETTKKALREGFLASYKELLETNPELAEEIDVDDNRFLQWYIKNSNVRKTEWDENVAKAYHTWFKKNKSKYIIKQKPVKRNYSGLPQDNKVEERNNMLIDISYAILTHKDVALNVLSPGNYDNLKLAARVASLVENKGLLLVFKREYNILSNTELALKLLNITLKEIDDFMSDHRIEKSLLSPSTFVYYHTLNMAGSKLISMYANNTTALAKFLTSDIKLKDYMVFRIDGRDIKLLNSITSEANELISKNCAECSAASVDNAKDPVLADLMQNPKTANILGTMLRAGMTIQEAGLLFTVPSIRAIIREKGKLDKDSIKDMLPGNIKISELLQEVDKTDFTSLDIMKSILDPGEDADKLILGLMYKIVGIADVMGELTRNSRADSPNGALLNSVVGAILLTERVSRLRRATSEKNFPLLGIKSSWLQTGDLYATPSTPKDILREKLKSSKMSRLQAFYTLGIDLPTLLLSDVFMHFNPDVRRITNYIFNNMEDMPYESTMEEAYRGITLYLLSKTRLFGDDEKLSAEEKRKYYTTKYARKFKRLLEQNPDVASIGVMLKLEVSDSKITMQRSARLTPTLREMFMSDFDSLLYHDNPIAQEMVKDLMMYSYYAENLNFGPNSFGNFFSPTFYNAFPELVEAIRLMGEGLMSDSERINIIELLYSNIPNLATKPERVEVAGNDGKDLKVVAKSVHNTSLGGTNTWDYIRIDDDVYKKSQENAEYVMYTPVPKLNNLYNANKSVDEINKLQDSLGITSNYSRLSTYSYDDVLDEIDAVIKKKDLTTEGNSGQTEAKYSSELGNKVLENKGMKPLC